MTVSTADLGGMGNGLGLPIANPLYGPAQAAQNASQAWQQNMANAQATTANTQALTGQTQELTRGEKLKNDPLAGMDPNLRIQAATSDLTGQMAKTESERRNLADQEYIKNAASYDNMPPGAAEQSQIALAKKYNIDPTDALNRWQGGAVAAAQAAAGAQGPAQAAFQYQGGGHTANAERLLRLNPELMRTAIEQQGATQRTGMQLTTEEKIAQQKMEQEAKLKEIDLKSNPQTAGQFWASKAFAAHQAGDTTSEAYAIRQTQDATDRNNSIKAFQAFMQQYMLYGMIGMSGPTGVTPGQAGGGAGAPPAVQSGSVNGKTYPVTPPGGNPAGSPSATPNMQGLPVPQQAAPQQPQGPAGPAPGVNPQAPPAQQAGQIDLQKEYENWLAFTPRNEEEAQRKAGSIAAIKREFAFQKMQQSGQPPQAQPQQQSPVPLTKQYGIEAVKAIASGQPIGPRRGFPSPEMVAQARKELALIQANLPQQRQMVSGRGWK